MSNDFAPSSDIKKAADLLNKGELVAMPTETVYGLAANAFDDSAVAKIYALKQRPTFNPLIAHFYDTDAVKQVVEFNELAENLANTFWPGALTMVLPKHKDCKISQLASAGLDTLAVRVPSHALAHELLGVLDFPLVAPSANPSEAISPTCAHDVASVFPDLFVLDGGECSVGLESTIIDLTGISPTILRPGGITKAEIEKCLGVEVASGSASNAIKAPKSPKAPGQLKRHYAPSIPVRLNATEVYTGEALLSFGEHDLNPNNCEEMNISVGGDLQEAAANLFKYLRALDTPHHKAIAIMQVPNHGIGVAINDRLNRAAAGEFGVSSIHLANL